MSNIEIMSPNQLKAAYAGEDGKGEFPAYTREEWREAVMHWSTEEGYWTWVHNCLCNESAEADAEEDMDITQVSYADKGTCTPIDEPKPTPAIEVPGSVPVDLRNRVYRILAEQLGLHERDISDDKILRDDLVADSLDLVELAMVIEEEFEIELPDAEIEVVTTVAGVLEVVLKKNWR